MRPLSNTFTNTMHPNTIQRAFIVKHLVDDYFEPGNQSRCLLQAWRNVIMKYYPCSMATFYRYISFASGIEGYLGNGSNRITVKKRVDKSLAASAVQLCLF